MFDRQAVHVLLKSLSISVLPDGLPMDYCAGENYEAKCGENEVIVMEKASYGRMRIGKCVKRDFGYLGCQTDVLHYMDGMCSGKRECALIKIPDQKLRDMRPCSELESYIHAAHSCQKGMVLPFVS